MAPFASRNPKAGYRSIEHANPGERTTVVKIEPAAPSTRPCEALMSAGSHSAAPEACVSAGAADGGGATDGGARDAAIDGAAVTAGDAVAGTEVGDGVEVHAASTTAAARNGAAARMEVRPRRSAIAAAA
jgi:hypothetical protein